MSKRDLSLIHGVGFGKTRKLYKVLAEYGGSNYIQEQRRRTLYVDGSSGHDWS